MNADKELIRFLNDEVRRNLFRGGAFMTPGVAALGSDVAEHIFQTITLYDSFCRDNDPHDEGDFGAFKVEEHTIFWKIDYFSRDMTMGSPDPSDPSVTRRVITIMLAEEY